MNIIKIAYLSLIGSLALIIMGSLCAVEPKDDVKALRLQLQELIELAGTELSHIDSDEIGQKYAHFTQLQRHDIPKLIVISRYNKIRAKYGHLPVSQWLDAYHTVDKRKSFGSWTYALFNTLEKGLTSIVQKRSDRLPFSHFILNHGIYYDVFEISNPSIDTNGVAQIVNGLIRLGNGGFHAASELFDEYNNLLIQNGHFTVSLWKEAFNCTTISGKETIIGLSGGWVGEKYTLELIRNMLDIAIKKGKGNITFKELINTIESFSDQNTSDNITIKAMIEQKEDLKNLGYL
jgi:hypothetical protein